MVMIVVSWAGDSSESDMDYTTHVLDCQQGLHPILDSREIDP